jgi:hypothetical protein
VKNVDFKNFGEIVCAFKIYKIVFSPHPNFLDLFCAKIQILGFINVSVIYFGIIGLYLDFN